MLRMKHRRLVVEVVVCPKADGGCPSNGGRNKCLLTEVEVKYAELVGNKV